MKKYLATGVIVQIFIIVLRWVLGKSRRIFKENKSNVFFWITLFLGSMVNVILWSISIVCEVILIKEEK
ncbi:MAG: hypothetical protein Q4F83_12115 [Eubacteriales bacterium]|nr:hypothetical protein [Eubacteriales bacterium]